jgi:RHS repeat-associated protein
MLRGRKIRRWGVPVVAASLLIATGGAAFGAPPAGRLPGVPEPKQAPAVNGVHALPTRFTRPAPKPKPYTPSRTTWPAGATSTIELRSPSPGARPGAAVRAATGTVWAQSIAAAGPRALHVKVLEHAVATAAGVAGVLFTVSADSSGDVRLGVDYDRFAEAYGGNYAGQLTLVRYPACVLTTPAAPACRVATPLRSSNDTDVRAVSAIVGVPAASEPAGLVLAVTAAATAPQGGSAGGTTSATSLKPSGSWSGGGSAGSFTYSYPLAEAASPSDLTPDFGLSYNSAVSDGETAATQSQSSWAGEGWNTPESFIEQSFQSCSESPEGSAAPVKTYDRCYDGPIYNMSINGTSTALVWDATAKVFKSESADGSVVVHYCTLPSGKTTFSDPTCVSGASNSSGTYFNDWWKVTGRDGTAYSFGLNHLPGWTGGKLATNSVAYQPVYSAHSGDPCYNATFSAAVCTMGYRWGLDYVVDAHANALSYYYNQDLNYYGSYNGATMRSYVRDQYLDHVDYGFTDGNAYGTAPDRYAFGSGPRCVSGTCTPLTAATAPNWPDVPFAQICASGATCGTQYPSYFSTVRLAGIASQQYSGSAYTTLDSYALSYSMPQTGDGTAPTLWLDQIVHSASAYSANGGTGTPITMPPVVFTATPPMANRLDTQTDGLPAYYKYRLGKITTETGSNITVSYYLPKACSASAKPAAASNTSSCYPVSWVPDGYTAPITDWFNKYAVRQVSQDDPTGGASAKVTSYDYPGGPAWHYDTNELVKAKYRSYAQFRGYGDVITYLGDGVNDPKAKSETTYYRGMSKNNSSTVVNLADSLNGAHEDADELAGKELETIGYLGALLDHSTITSYWVSGAAATRARTGLPALTSNWVAPVETYDRQAITGSGATTWRNTETDTSYVSSPTDPNFGLAVRRYDHTSPAAAAYDTCTSTTYAVPNTAKNLVGLTAEEEVLSTACGGYTAGSVISVPGSLNTLTAPVTVSRPAQVVSATRTYYADPTFSTTFPQAAPANGDVTMERGAADYSGGSYVWQTSSQAKFDSVGRQTDDIDGNGNDTRTVVATDSLGLVTSRTETNPLGHATTTTMDTQRAVPLTVTDPNGAVTTLRYDALGRTTSVWLNSRATSTAADYLYSYAISAAGPTAVTMQKLNDELGYQTSTLIYDGLLRERQIQTGTPRDGRLVSDIFYDSRGWTGAKYADWWDDDTTPTTTTVSAANLHKQVPMQHVYTHDSLGRVVVDRNENNGVEVASTTAAYNGDRTTILPPAGGTATTTVTDPLGRTVELDSYLTRPALTSPADPFTTPFTVSGGTKQVTTYGYDNRGNEATTQQGTAGGAPVWTSTYNLLGQVTSKADPDAGTVTDMRYDLGGNLTQSTDSRGRTISYTYDALDRRTGTFASALAAQQPADVVAGTTGNQLSKWVYDNANGIAGVTHALGRLTTSYAFAGGSTYATQQTDFNVFGSSLGTSVTIPATEGALGGTYTVKHTYTSNTGLPLRDIYAAKGGLPAEQVLHTYRSAFDLPDGLSGVAGYTQTTSYDALSRVNQTKFGPSTSTFTTVDNTYDPNSGDLTDQLVSTTSAGTTRAVDEQRYRYDKAGNLTVQSDARQGSAATAETQCFGYDGLDQLTAAWTANDDCATAPSSSNSGMVADGLGATSAYWTTWQFDGLGDRQSQVQHAFSGGPAADTTTAYGYGNSSGGQPHTLTSTSTTGGTAGSTSYGYDQAGGMTTRNAGNGAQTMSYDEAGQLVAVSGSTTGNSAYVYDADGTLLLQNDPATTVLYVGDQQFTLTKATGAVSGDRYYRLPGGSQVVRTGSATNSFSYTLGDQHGTPTLYLDNTSQNPTWRQYTPYGAARGASVTAPDNRGFLDKAMDGATGLTIVGARQYDPDTGRFITLDPVLETHDPTQLNGYGYAGNNPVTHADPTGLMLPLDERPAPPPHTDARHTALVRYHHRSAPVSRTTSHHPLDRHEALRRHHPYVTPYDVDGRHAALIRHGAARHTYAAHVVDRRSTSDVSDRIHAMLARTTQTVSKEDTGSKKVGGGMFEVCLSGIAGLGVSGVGSLCVAADRKGVGSIETLGAGGWFGGGAGGTIGGGISNGSIDDQAGDSVGLDVQGFVAGKVDVNVAKSTSANVWTASGNVGGGPGGGVLWVGGTHSKTQRWFDW